MKVEASCPAPHTGGATLGSHQKERLRVVAWPFLG